LELTPHKLTNLEEGKNMRLELDTDEMDLEKIKELVFPLIAAASPGEILFIEILRLPKHNKVARLVGDGRKIALLRAAKGWNQAELANKARIEPSTLSRIESGFIKNPRDELLDLLAKQLDVPADELRKPARD